MKRYKYKVFKVFNFWIATNKKTIRLRITYVFWEPGRDEGHAEGVGVGVEGVEGVWLDARHHGPDAAGELAADCTRVFCVCFPFT